LHTREDVFCQWRERLHEACEAFRSEQVVRRGLLFRRGDEGDAEASPSDRREEGNGEAQDSYRRLSEDR